MLLQRYLTPVLARIAAYSIHDRRPRRVFYHIGWDLISSSDRLPSMTTHSDMAPQQSDSGLVGVGGPGVVLGNAV
jgi:hypothetical protein